MKKILEIPKFRKVYKALKQYPEGATIFDLSKLSKLASPQTHSAIKSLIYEGLVKRGGLTSDAQRKGSKTEAAQLYLIAGDGEQA